MNPCVNRKASLGDLCTVYITVCNTNATVLLMRACAEVAVRSFSWDEEQGW